MPRSRAHSGGINVADEELQDETAVPLVRNLAVVTQLHLPGTAGRLSQQIRDLESAAPAFSEAGLVRKVQRPTPLNVHAAGIATETPPPQRVMGGFLYAAGAVRLDVLVEDNRVATGTQDSVCEVDDIDYEDQRERLKLLSIRQAYELADAALRDGERRELLLLDCPLLLSRSMAAPREDGAHRGHREAYDAAFATVERFWATHRESLFPWASDGPVVVSVGSGRYGAVLQLAEQDLRTAAGRQFVLPTESIETSRLAAVERMERTILSIGERRFLQGLLGPFTRTAAYLLNVQSPRMEPAPLVREGVVGFHFKGAEGTSARFAHVLGSPERWTARALDRVAGLLMGMSAIGGRQAEPLPILLARRELRPLPGFLEHYARQVRAHLHHRKLEAGWLEGLDELD
jgi:hypothetical protein